MANSGPWTLEGGRRAEGGRKEGGRTAAEEVRSNDDSSSI